MRKLSPCIWMNNNVDEAVKLYKSAFKNFKIQAKAYYDDVFAKASGMPEGSLLVMTTKIEGLEIMLLNGGPLFKPNPSMSFMVNCTSAKEVDDKYKKLSQNGKVMMELGEYPFSKRYAWVEDKFGVSWQLMLGKSKQKITPCLMYVGKEVGHAKDAIKLYTSVFKDGKTKMISKYEKGEPDVTGYIKYGLINIHGTDIALMESSGDHKFQFNEGNSLIIYCKDQKEVDYYWKKLTSNGGQESMCGWLKDKFGVNWQITPEAIEKLMTSKKKKNVFRMNSEMYKMRKLNLKVLLDAYYDRCTSIKNNSNKKISEV